MLVVLKKDKEEISRQTARMIAGAVKRKPSMVLGLATGGTMIGVYKELVKIHKEEGVDFSRVVTFNLDEYLGLSAKHTQSFRYFMQENFFSRVNVRAENIHVPDGTITGEFEKYCAGYEQSIRDAGGIDLQLLGIGRNGHIGFNEPMSSLASRTRLKVLSSETIGDNRKSFGAEEAIPKCAITVGTGTILEARKILLVATGASKASAIERAIEGPIAAAVTASVLQLHPDVTFLIDEPAGAELKQREYYKEVLEMTASLTPERLN
jgi:glucosamine-6-phosphate deaminase